MDLPLKVWVVGILIKSLEATALEEAIPEAARYVNERIPNPSFPIVFRIHTNGGLHQFYGILHANGVYGSIWGYTVGSESPTVYFEGSLDSNVNKTGKQR